MNKMEKFKNTVYEILASLGASPQLKVLQEAKVRTPERDSIPLLFLNMIIEIVFLHNITDREYGPVNLIFIAKSGIGKSRLLATLRYLDFVYYCEDITPKHLKDFLEKVRDGKKRLLVIPDFNSIISAHGQKTQHTTLSILRELIHGITNLAAYGMEFESKFPVKAGVITAMTIDNYSKFRETWKTTGFLNRFIPYSFRHGDLTQEKILHSIFYKDEVRFISSKPYNIIRHPPKDIEMNPQLVETLSDIAKDLAEICQATPYRDAIRLTDLLYVFLVIQGAPKLTIEHVNQFRKLIRYVNYDFNEV